MLETTKVLSSFIERDSMEITNERKEELLNKFLLHYDMPKREDLDEVDFEELEYLIRSAQVFHDKKEIPADNLLEKRDRYTELLMSRLWQLEGIFIAGDPHTQYPHIMGDGSIMIFSTEEMANKAAEHYEEQGLGLEIQFVPKDGMRHFFMDCYWWGMELLVLDMGIYSVHINRTKLMPPPDERKIPKVARPVRNPAFMAACIQRRQLLFLENRDEKWTRSERIMCDRMLRDCGNGISIGASVESTSELEQILADYLKTQKDVKRAFLAMKITQDMDVCYLLVLDMKEEEKSELEGIAKAVQGKLGALRLEFR